MASTSISCKGDRQFVMQLKALAAMRGVTLADLVRKALDEAYGDDLTKAASFFDDGVASTQHLECEVVKS